MAPGASDRSERGHKHSHDASHEGSPRSRSSSRKTSLQSASSRASPVSVSDENLISIAASTKNSTDWENILLSARTGPGRWKLHHQTGAFAVYTRQESQRFDVLAVGLVHGSPGEIMNVLQSPNSAQYAQQMAGILEDQFKDGSFVYQVLRSKEKLRDKEVQLVDLTVKTVTFEKSGWLASHEEWCYLDAVYRHGSTGAAEKLMTTLEPSTILAGLSSIRSKHVHNITCAYLLLPENHKIDSKVNLKTPRSNQGEETAAKDTVVATRVHFHAELLMPKQVGFHMPSLGTAVSDKAIKQRLLKFADSCARLGLLIKRQRLGVQDVVNYARFIPPTNTPCMVCTKMLLVAKVCKLCGKGVCKDCSQKHERATQPKGSELIHVETIRVCADCMHRVDRASYDNLTPLSLKGPHIVPDPIDTTPPDAALKGLLHDALLKAPSPSRKAGVMNVIKCVLEQEASQRSESSSPSRLTPASSERDYLEALESLYVEHYSYDQAPYRSHEDRCYQIDTSNPDSALNAPLAEHEEERLRAVEQVDMDQLCESAELNILCQLAAAEMNCSTSTISIFDRDTLNCVATNVDAYARLKLPRWNTMCAHTILDKRPHLIPHPESDIRMADALVVTGFGVRFYFAFPVVDADEQIIGSYCVMNEQSQEITESQYSAFKKLADTCNKVVQLHIERRRTPSISS